MTTLSLPEQQALAKRLAAPFPPKEIKCRPGLVKGNRALALFYCDSRMVQDRLDDVLGIGNWSDQYEYLPDGSVACRLSIRLGDEWIVKSDVGGPSEQPDGGDRLKAAVSDALKRTAVKWGIGRYLYGLGKVWADYDPQRKWFTQPPRVPNVAEPEDHGPASGAPAQQSPPAQQQAAPSAANGRPAGPQLDPLMQQRLDGARKMIPMAKDQLTLEKQAGWVMAQKFPQPYYDELSKLIVDRERSEE